MAKRRWAYRAIMLLIGVLAIVAADQLAKFWLTGWASQGREWGPISLLLHHNYGISFGIELPSLLATGLIVGFLILLLGLFFASHRQLPVYFLGLGLCIGGGASNLWDRLSLGFVRDFVSVGILPIFNLADILILIGVVLMVIGALIHGPRQDPSI